MALHVLLCIAGILGAVGAQPGPTRMSTSAVDLYTALVQVNIRCSNDPVSGLTCAAEYPDQCREQWNFPNPCTRQNLDMNITKFVHPFDKTKFLMCGQLGKLYVVQCPQYEVFHDGCGQCIGEEAGLTASCEIPLPPVHNNPCTREAILANKLFFPFPGNLSKFIHCDIWGKPWERICTPGEVWSQWDVTCVLPHLLNPCNRPTTDLNYLYSHPCDPAKYLTCDAQGRAHEINCALGEAFYERNQRCQPYRDFEDQILSSFCENYIFGFRQHHGSGGFAIDPSRTAESVDLGLVTHEGIKVAGTGTISGIIGGGFNRDSRGFTMDRTSRNLDGSVRFTKDDAGQIRTNVDLRGGVLNRQTELHGQGDGTIGFDRSSQVRGGKLSGQIATDGQGGVESSFEVKRGSIDGSKSSTVDAIQTLFGQGTGAIDQAFDGGAATNFVNTGGKALSNGPTTAEFVDIQNQGTSGTSANMIDIIGEKGSGPRDLFDIRSGTAEGKMVDIRGSQVVESGGMVGISGQDVGSGSGNIFDVRGGKVSGTKKMVDIRGDSSGGSLDIKKSQKEVSGGMIDINKGTVPIVNGRSKMVDIGGGGQLDNIRGGISESVLTDIRTSATGARGSMIDLVGIEGVTGGTDGNMVDIRSSKIEKSGGMTEILGTKVDTSGTVGGTSGDEFIDVRIAKLDTTGSMAGSSDPLVGTSRTVDIHGSNIDPTGGMLNAIGSKIDTPGMPDILGSTDGIFDTSGTVDIREGTNMVALRTAKGDTTDTVIDFGGLEGITGNVGDTGMVDIRGPQFETSKSKVDIRKATDGTSGLVKIHGSKTDTTGGMADIHNVGTIGTGTVIDFGGLEGVTGNTGDTGIVDITVTKTRVDIRKPQGDISGSKIDTTSGMLDTSGMVDIRNVDTTGPIIDFGGIKGVTGNVGDTGMVDITGAKFETSKSKVDIRKATDDTSGLVKIRGSKTDTTGGMLDTSGMVDIRNVDTTGPIINFGGLKGVTGNIDDTGMVDIRGPKFETSKGKVDIRKATDGTSGFVKIHGSKTDTTGGMADIHNVGTTGTVIDFGGLDSVTGNTGDTGMVDITVTKTGVDIRKTQGDISGSKIDTTGGMLDTSGLLDIHNVDQTGTIIDFGGLESGTASSSGTGTVHIRGSKTKVDIRKAQGDTTGMVDILGSKIDTTGGLLDTSGMVDIDIRNLDPTGPVIDFSGLESRTAGSRSTGMVDITGSRIDTTRTAGDITGSQVDTSGIEFGIGSKNDASVDIHGSKIDTTRLTDIRGARLDTTGVVDAIPGSFSESSSVKAHGSRIETSVGAVDIAGKPSGISGGVMVDIRREGMIDMPGPSDGIDVISQGIGSIDSVMTDIRSGKVSGKKTKVDIRGGATKSGFLDVTGSKTGLSSDAVDITRQGRNQPLSGQTSDVQWVNMRSKQGQGSIMGSNEMGLGGMTTIDLRKQLGLSGQGGITNDQNGGATEVTRTDTITIEGTVQGAPSSGTMQDLLNTWNKIIREGGNGRHAFSQITGRRDMSTGGVFESGLNQPGNGKVIDTRMTVHPSRLKMYDYSDIPFNEPCTQENIDAGRTHFRFRNHPHMFLQCDASGRMHRMPCSTKGRDWFDVYTNTCVDGPVHVENLLL